MGAFNIECFEIKNKYLEITTTSEVLYKMDEIKLILVNRFTKENQVYYPNVSKLESFTKISLRLDEINIDTMSKNIIDIYIENENKKERLIKKSIDLKCKYNKYSNDFYKIDDIRIMVPYLTEKNEVSILYGDMNSVFRSFCNIIKSKVTIDNIMVTEYSISFNIPSFIVNKYDCLMITLLNTKSKNILQLKYDVIGKRININLKQLSHLNENGIYDLYLETKFENTLMMFRVGEATTEDIVLYNKISLNSYVEVLPLSKNGGFSIVIGDENFVNNEKYIVSSNSIYITDIQLVNQDLLIKNVNFREESVLNRSNKLVLKDSKNNLLKILDENQAIMNEDKNIMIHLDKIFDNSVLEYGERWNIFIGEVNKDFIVLNELVKGTSWVDTKINRYFKPININNIEVVVYTTEKNQLSFLIGDKDIYSKEVYRRTTGYSNIENLRVEDRILSFKLKNIELQKIEDISFVLMERKSKIQWRKAIDKSKILYNEDLSVNLQEFICEFGENTSRWDAYIKFTLEDIISLNKIGLFNDSVKSSYSRYFKIIKYNDNSIAPYLTIKNELSIVIDTDTKVQNEKLKTNIYLKGFSMKQNIITGAVDLEVLQCEDFKVKSMIMKHRSKTSGKFFTIPFSVDDNNKSKVKISFKVDLTMYEFEQFYWDFYVVIFVDEEEYLIRVKNPSNKIRKSINRKLIKFSYTYENEYFVYPYITKVNTLALDYRKKEEYESSSFKIKENLAFYTYKIFKRYFDKKDIWIAYEKFAEGAQDNGFYFFDYCYRNKKKENFYYIIKQNSPDYENVAGMKDKVIKFMSFKYMLYMYAAKLFISSESKGHSYDIRIQKGRIREYLNNKKHVFLQHGVTALKRVDYVFNKNTSNAVDIFVATSDYEKEIIKNNFGYNEEEIITTGFCRWDVLKDKSGNKKQIFLMPTWRVWMDDFEEDKFILSEYYKKYVGLINSKELIDILHEKNITFCFYIHPKFKSYIDKFTSNSNNIKIYQYGEEKVNDLLMESSMLITDYSSVAWDMYYQKKPVLFYQFDIEDYNKYQGSYLNMETELFGDRLFEVDDLVSSIKEYIDRDFMEKDIYAQMREKYFKFVDSNNCERTYEAIISKKSILNNENDTLIRSIRKNKFMKKVWKKVSKNSRVLKNINKKLPR